ncbi:MULTISPECIES: GAP family protein [unclassified Streptomyces]|uniref:GAP family protein n=1 Tax=unclassified Streptomyces TaxID=2593676 RepID=UPI002E120322|nr:GAP family protein [Streptomyces sp. NBC_01241]WSP65419.1 GAP family protein [Streptomyces sp. NBC_01240]WSU24592.1 GAP family protein [Streptomyces sp. NBC_01108]
MGAVLGDVLGFAAAVAVSPLPIIAIILILATPRGRLNGILFTVDWTRGLSALGAVIPAVASPAGASTDNHPATWVGALELALGLFLVLFSARQVRYSTSRSVKNGRLTCPGNPAISAGRVTNDVKRQAEAEESLGVRGLAEGRSEFGPWAGGCMRGEGFAGGEEGVNAKVTKE